MPEGESVNSGQVNQGECQFLKRKEEANEIE